MDVVNTKARPPSQGKLQTLNEENSQLAHGLEVSNAQAAELARARAELEATKLDLTVIWMHEDALNY